MATSTLQLRSQGSKGDKKKRIKIKEEFFQLYNNQKCIKWILYKYFAEFTDFITSNRDAKSCYSYCNEFLYLKVPKRIIYDKKRAAFNIKKNFILNRLKIQAQDLAVLKVIGRSAIFLIYYTVAVPHTMLN